MDEGLAEIISTITADFPGIEVQHDEVHANVGQPLHTMLTLDVNDSPAASIALRF